MSSMLFHLVVLRKGAIARRAREHALRVMNFLRFLVRCVTLSAQGPIHVTQSSANNIVTQSSANRPMALPRQLRTDLFIPNSTFP